MADAINGDLSVRVVMDTARMAWTQSPSASVWRKRVHRVGPPESGQVTSVVRYEPRSTFPAHDHPDGEEILVLDGVFSDEHGDWPAGTFLLNPEGFRHAPFSDEGCVLFVKLRQFQGLDRNRVVVRANEPAWSPGAVPGVGCKSLYQQAGYADRVRLERFDPGADPGAVGYPEGAELFVIEGALADEAGTYPAGCWLRFPAGAQHHPRSACGCTLYVKEAGLRYLSSAT